MDRDTLLYKIRDTAILSKGQIKGYKEGNITEYS
jgi:hypothetical protein